MSFQKIKSIPDCVGGRQLSSTTKMGRLHLRVENFSLICDQHVIENKPMTVCVNTKAAEGDGSFFKSQGKKVLCGALWQIKRCEQFFGKS